MRKLIVFCFLIITSLGLVACYDSEKIITKAIKLDVVDISDNYKVKAKKLQTYYYKEVPGIAYVDIEEFLHLMDGVIIEFEITKTDTLTLSYSDKETTFVIVFDAENDTIYTNNFELLTQINTEPVIHYYTDIYLMSLDIVEGDLEVEIDLSLYNMDIVRDKDNYYIPLYLANMFLTGANVEVYEIDKSLYVFDLQSDFQKLFSKFTKVKRRKKVSEVKLHTKNYLALYFDYFYGLKSYYNIDSYMKILDELNFEDVRSFHDLHEKVDDFIIYLDDIHTSMFTAGYMSVNYEPRYPNSKRKNFRKTYGEKCWFNKNEVEYEIIDDVFFIKINAFSLDTRNLISSVMDIAKKQNPSKVVIDLSCNTGGNVAGVIETLVYLTRFFIPLSYMNAKTQTFVTEYYQDMNNKALKSNFYIVSSPVTFSAANIFLSIVKDLELGLIIGEKSSGGASAITVTTLPDGAIIINSSNMNFINLAGNIIEEGIMPDIPNLNPFNQEEVISMINHLFSYNFDTYINKNIANNKIYYEISINPKAESLDLIEVDEYFITLYHEDELIDYFSFNDDIIYQINNVLDEYQFIISVKYKIKNMEIEEIIYEDIVN